MSLIGTPALSSRRILKTEQNQQSRSDVRHPQQVNLRRKAARGVGSEKGDDKPAKDGVRVPVHGGERQEVVRSLNPRRK